MIPERIPNWLIQKTNIHLISSERKDSNLSSSFDMSSLVAMISFLLIKSSSIAFVTLFACSSGRDDGRISYIFNVLTAPKYNNNLIMNR